MSDNHLSIKINSNILINLAVFILLLFLVVANARLLINNFTRSKGIDEVILSQANPRLNRQLIENAMKTLDSLGSQELTSIFTSDTVNNEATEPGIIKQISVSVENASGINGAAAAVANSLNSNGYQVNSVSTAQSLQNTTQVLFQTGSEKQAQAIKAILEDEGWPVKSVQKSEELKTDISVLLGK